MHKLPCVAHLVGRIYLMFLCYIAVQQNLLAPIKKKKNLRNIYIEMFTYSVWNTFFNTETTKCNFQSVLKETVKTLHYLRKQAVSPVSPGSYLHTENIWDFFTFFCLSKYRQLGVYEKSTLLSSWQWCNYLTTFPSLVLENTSKEEQCRKKRLVICKK